MDNGEAYEALVTLARTQIKNNNASDEDLAWYLKNCGVSHPRVVENIIKDARKF